MENAHGRGQAVPLLLFFPYGGSECWRYREGNVRERQLTPDRKAVFWRRQVRILLGLCLMTTVIFPSCLHGAECSLTISAFDPQGAPVRISYLDIVMADEPGTSLRFGVVVERVEKHPNSYTLRFNKKIGRIKFDVKSRL